VTLHSFKPKEERLVMPTPSKHDPAKARARKEAVIVGLFILFVVFVVLPLVSSILDWWDKL
jgi:hypothetical protein